MHRKRYTFVDMSVSPSNAASANNKNKKKFNKKCEKRRIVASALGTHNNKMHCRHLARLYDLTSCMQVCVCVRVSVYLNCM